MRCLVCGNSPCICKGTAPEPQHVVDVPERITIMAGKLVKVRTGKSSYLRMTEKEATEYRKTVGEYSESADEGVDLAEEQANQQAAGEGKTSKKAQA